MAGIAAAEDPYKLPLERDELPRPHAKRALDIKILAFAALTAVGIVFLACLYAGVFPVGLVSVIVGGACFVVGIGGLVFSKPGNKIHAVKPAEEDSYESDSESKEVEAAANQPVSIAWRIIEETENKMIISCGNKGTQLILERKEDKIVKYWKKADAFRPFDDSDFIKFPEEMQRVVGNFITPDNPYPTESPQPVFPAGIEFISTPINQYSSLKKDSQGTHSCTLQALVIIERLLFSGSLEIRSEDIAVTIRRALEVDKNARDILETPPNKNFAVDDITFLMSETIARMETNSFAIGMREDISRYMQNIAEHVKERVGFVMTIVGLSFAIFIDKVSSSYFFYDSHGQVIPTKVSATGGHSGAYLIKYTNIEDLLAYVFQMFQKYAESRDLRLRQIDFTPIISVKPLVGSIHESSEVKDRER